MRNVSNIVESAKKRQSKRWWPMSAAGCIVCNFPRFQDKNSRFLNKLGWVCSVCFAAKLHCIPELNRRLSKKQKVGLAI